MSIYREIETSFATTRGKGNTQIALIFSDKRFAKKQESPDVHTYALDKALIFKRQACFANIYWRIRDVKKIKKIVFDLRNPAATYGNHDKDLAEDLLKQLYHTPWMKKNILNPTLKDAWNNNLRMKVDPSMSNEEVFMPLYVFRHIWECKAWDVYGQLLKTKLFTKREAAWLSLCLTPSLNYRPGGHSAICSSLLNMDKYLHIMLGESPNFQSKRTPFFGGSPYINLVLGGGLPVKYTKRVGEGFYQKSLADLEKIHEKLQELKKIKKKLKNA